MRTAFFSVFAAVILLWSIISQGTAEEITASVSFTVSELSFHKIENYDVIYMRDCDITRESGEPLLPVKLVHVSLPPGAVVEGVEVVSAERVPLEGTYMIYPVQPPQILGTPDERLIQVEFVGPKESVYQSHDAYPSRRVVFTHAGSMGGFTIAGFLMYPLQYLPAEGILLFHPRIDFQVRYTLRPGQPRLLKGRPGGADEIHRRTVERMVVNPDEMYQRSGLQGHIESHVPPGEYEYVVVTDGSFTSAFQPLIDWKTKKGVPATVVTTSWICENYSGADTQEHIRNFIRDAYEQWGTLWVLLGGDTDIVPCRLTWAMDCEYGGEPDENDIPADLYYADLDGTWDENGNGTFGEVDDGVDLYPDVFVGRASVNTLREVHTFVTKMLTYEQPVDTDVFLRYLFLGEIMWQSPYTDGGDGKNMIDDECIPPRFDPITKLYQSLGNESRESVIEAINEGYHIVNHDGHCWWTVMGVGSGSLVRTDMDGLRNDPAYSIIYSIGCWPAAIDYNCIAENFVNNPYGGGVAFIGNSRYGWGSPGNPGYGYSDRFDHRFYVELFHNGISNIGATLGAAKAYYVNRSRQENVYRIHQYEVNLLGDPEMDIWTNRPKVLTVRHPAEVPMDSSSFTVSVASGGTPVEGAMVCLMNGAGLYDRGKTNGAGQGNFEIHPGSIDTVWVTVTFHDCLPHEGFATVFDAGPFVGSSTSTLRDSLVGNDDGLVNPGETIGLSVRLKNYGRESAKDVAGKLRTADPMATVLDSLFDFGNLPPGGEVLPAGAECFTFEISSQAANGHTVRFNLELSDSAGHLWTDIIPVTVAAPVLGLDGYRVDDSSGGNGNGLVESGETIDVEVDISNRGLGIAYDVTVRPQAGSCDIALLDTLLAIGDIQPGSTATCSFSVEFTDVMCPVPEFDTYTLTVSTGDGFSFLDGFSMARFQGEWGFSDDMESGEALWTHEGQGDLWHLTQHRSHSGTFSWYCGHEERWKYDKSMDCSLISQPITLGPRAGLSFWHWYEVAVYGVNGVVVEIDAGSGWKKLDFIGSGGALLPISNDWIEDTYDLSAYPAGTQVQVRFRFVSDRERTFEGMYIDDVRMDSDFSAPLPILSLQHVAFDDDTLGSSHGNGNGSLDCGETIELSVDVLNYGDALAPGVAVDIGTNDPYVSILTGSLDLGDIDPGMEVSGADDLLIRLSDDAPNRHDVYLTLRMTDGKGNVWDESMVLTVSQPEFVIDAFSAPDVIGNGDGNPERGEICNLIVSLQNVGLRSAEGITATITTPCADVVIVDETSVFHNIPVDSTGHNAESPFRFYIESNTTDHVIPFQMSLREGDGFCEKEISLSVLMNQGQILLVADDGTYRNSQYYTEVLSALGVPYRIWSVADQGEVPQDTILSFREVIWFTGAEASNTLTEQDCNALIHFLDGGGHLILSGNMIGVYIGSTEFYSDYLHAAYISFMTQLHNVMSVEGNPIIDDMYLHLAEEGPTTQGFCGEIDPLVPAVGLFEYDRTTEEGPGLIRSSGMGAIAVETNGYKAAYFSFGLEGIEHFRSRYDVFEALFSWFRGRAIDVRAILGFADCFIDDDQYGDSSGDNDGFANPGENIELTVSLSNTGALISENVVGVLRTTDEFIVVSDSTASYGNIDPDSVVQSSDCFLCAISPETPQGHEVNFEVSLMDGQGNRWSDEFTLTIHLTSTLSGRISDVGTGLGISGASLHWIGPLGDGTIEYNEGVVSTNENGGFLFALINGRYVIRAEAAGFLASEWEEIEFLADTGGLDFALVSPRMECEPKSFTFSLISGETRTSVLEISNTNTGFLHYAFLEVEPSSYRHSSDGSFGYGPPYQSNADFAANFQQSVAAENATAPDPERWRLIYLDDDEEGIPYDFDRLYAQNDERDLYFKITAQEAWSDPRFDFDVYVFIDADRSAETGLRIWDLGADYVIIAGTASLLASWDWRSQSFGYHAPLSYGRQASNCDSLEVGIRLTDIGTPQLVDLYFQFFNMSMEYVDDEAPDGGLLYIPYSTFDADWISVEPPFGFVLEGASEDVLLRVDAAELLPGEYSVHLVIENNQPEGGPVFIPVHVTVSQTGCEDGVTRLLPAEYTLAQNYPNPFNPTTTIQYAIPGTEPRAQSEGRGTDAGLDALRTTLTLYNVLGQEVRTLVDELKKPGYYTVTWDGKNKGGNDVPTGIYFYTLRVGEFSQTKRMLLMK